MAERRPLIEGLKPSDPAVDPNKEKEFVFGGKATATADEAARIAAPPSDQPATIAHRPRAAQHADAADFAAALKRARSNASSKASSPIRCKTSWSRRSSPGFAATAI